MKTHKDLEVYKNAIDFVTNIYEITKSFPVSERFGLTNQIKRSAISIPSNIAEGATRNYDKEFIQFLYVSLGSVSEIDTQLIISKNIGFITENIYTTLEKKLDLIKVELMGLIKYLKNKSK